MTFRRSVATIAAAALFLSFAPVAQAQDPVATAFELAEWGLAGKCAGPQGFLGVNTGVQCVHLGRAPMSYDCTPLPGQEYFCRATFTANVTIKRWVTEGSFVAAMSGDCAGAADGEWAADAESLTGRLWQFSCTTGYVFVPYAGCARHTVTASISVEGTFAPVVPTQTWVSELCFG